ncbi:unnamed protein product [Larinioides sclopetarius]|uniref:Uncharacterized protein n=1 Tax=Larinioides sclopetarius TaxID=280406 RepID=A0AAV2B415_9ARAC
MPAFEQSSTSTYYSIFLFDIIVELSSPIFPLSTAN